MSRELHATVEINIPQASLCRDAFEAQFATVTRFAYPYHPKLALFCAKLHFQQFAQSNLPAESLNEGSAAADAGSPRVLYERIRIRIQPPDTDRKYCFDSRAAATIHAAIVEKLGKEGNLRQLYGGVPKVLT